MRVGWIGLGAMGRPMALAAARAGHIVRGYARRPAELADVEDAGIPVTDHLLGTAADAEVTCVTLFSEAQVREVVIDGGLLAALPAGSILVLHSTVSPDFAQDVARMRDDVAVLDAGFSGGPAEAASGHLTLMVGGDAQALERSRPVLASYCDHIAHLGPVGAGMTLKVINNLMFAANVAIARDALRLVDRKGLELGAAVETLGRGSAGSTALRLLGRGGQPEATLDAIRHYLEKDVAIARDGARGMPLGALDAATLEFAK